MRPLLIAALLAAATVALSSGPASAAPKLRVCGNLTAGNGLLIGDVTTKRVRCPLARDVARAVPERCGTDGGDFCTVRGFACVTGRAAPELRLARCSKSRANSQLFKTIWFEFGS
ncbi:MAG: hypothetical protein ACAH82_14960 [Solirubrobacteraceae bacterium]